MISLDAQIDTKCPWRRQFCLLAALILSVFLCVACHTKPNETTPEKHYSMEGEVVSLNPRLQTATIKHGPIQGWMEAMTMDYPIRSKQDFEKLHPGDHISATVNVRGSDYDLTDIRELKNAP
jgi:Cu/Ag efflux protein CusF